MLSTWNQPTFGRRQRGFGGGTDWIDRDINNMMGDFFGDTDQYLMMMSPMGLGTNQLETILPQGERSDVDIPIDFFEKTNEYLIHCEIPGIPKENIEIKMEPNNMLVISATKEKCCPVESSDKVRRHERICGKVYRQLRLPINADFDKSEATHCNGVVCLKIPKHDIQQTGFKQLQIK